jgi:hypothetical protein
MSTPDESAEVQGLKVYGYVSRLAESGATPAEIQQKLIEKGVAPRDAARLMDRLAVAQVKRDIRVRASNLLDQGVPPDQVHSGLVQEAFDPAIVAEQTNAVITERALADREWKEDPRRLWLLLGAALIVVGVGVYLGNKTGAFPTVPFAGGILMGVGAVVSAMGRFRRA